MSCGLDFIVNKQGIHSMKSRIIHTICSTIPLGGITQYFNFLKGLMGLSKFKPYEVTPLFISHTHKIVILSDSTFLWKGVNW